MPEIEMITVIAPAGKTCPRELSRATITDSLPVIVVANSYYRRLIAEGSLIVVDLPVATPTPETKSKKGSK
jgi:hypothetical protein